MQNDGERIRAVKEASDHARLITQVSEFEADLNLWSSGRKNPHHYKDPLMTAVNELSKA
jgi:hypothetical protein